MHTSTLHQRIAELVEARLRDAVPDTRVRTAVVRIVGRWIGADPDHVVPDPAGWVRLAPATAARLARIGRTLAWMADLRRHHGQQATEEANKTLRALCNARLDVPALDEHCKRFRALRHAHIQRNALDKEGAPAIHIFLPGTDTLAIRMATVRDLEQLGRAAGNCLATLAPANEYRRRLRQGLSEFWKIHDRSDNLLCVVQFNRQREIEEVAAPGNAALCQAGRAALLELANLIDLRVRPPIDRLAQLGICHEPAPAVRTGCERRIQASVGFRDCEIRALPGALILFPRRSLTGWSLNAFSCNAPDGPLCSVRRFHLTECDEIYTVSEVSTSYHTQAWKRHALREACRRYPHVAEVCAWALAGAPDWFLDDWLGLSTDVSVGARA